MRDLESQLTHVPVAALAEAIVVTGGDGRIALVNPAAEALFGADAGALTGQALDDLVPLAPVAAGEDSGGAVRSALRRPDGTQLLVDIGFATVPGDDGPVVVCALRPAPPEPGGKEAADDDAPAAAVASALRRLEELGDAGRRIEALDAHGRLAGRVAHDLNNLFGVIRNFAQFALEGVPRGSQSADDLAQVVRAVERGMTLSQQLIVLGRREPLEPQPVALADAVESALAGARPELGPGVEVHTELDHGLPFVAMDPLAASRLVRALVLHAGAMLPAGGTVTIATRAGAPGHVELVVGLAGPDMAEPPERPFEPVFASEGEEEFPGLRLTLAHREVTRAGGTIELEADDGRTTVTAALLAAPPTR